MQCLMDWSIYLVLGEWYPIVAEAPTYAVHPKVDGWYSKSAEAPTYAIHPKVAVQEGSTEKTRI